MKENKCNNYMNSELNNLELNKSSSKDNLQEKKFSKSKCNFIILIALLFVILIIILIYCLIKNNSEKEKNASNEELIFAKNNPVKLNDLNLSSFNTSYDYDEEYLNSFYDFTINFFELINYTDFSPITLYSALINLYMCISDNEESKKLNEILGLNHDERLIFYNQIFQNNYFSNSDGEIKINNGAFYNSDNVRENESFIKEFNKTYTECYKLSYKKDFNFILDWINYSIKEKNFIDKSSFNDINNIAILLISSLYYKQK